MYVDIVKLNKENSLFFSLSLSQNEVKQYPVICLRRENNSPIEKNTWKSGLDN